MVRTLKITAVCAAACGVLAVPAPAQPPAPADGTARVETGIAQSASATASAPSLKRICGTGTDSSELVTRSGHGSSCAGGRTLMRDWRQAAVTATLSASAGAFAQTTAATGCAASFRVVHDDHVGTLQLPAGAYRVATTKLSCAQASALFSEFLDDFDGVLPAPWRTAPDAVREDATATRSAARREGHVLESGAASDGSTSSGSPASGACGGSTAAAACLRASFLACLRSLRSRTAFSRLSFANVVFFFALDANGVSLSCRGS